MSLSDLELRAQSDFEIIGYPASNWIHHVFAPNGEKAFDTIIVGAGMLGLTASLALKRVGVENHIVLDKSSGGREGPWVTYARMETLRSPKHLVGPAQDLPSLSFRSWFSAIFGELAWEALGKIPRTVWMDYLGSGLIDRTRRV